jgi:hypothetical protein
VRSIEILREKLSADFAFLHSRRQDSLWRAVGALMVGGRLWLTALGRDMEGPAREKHRIKAADRLLGCSAVQENLVRMYRALAAWLLRGSTRPVLLVDWTACGSQHFVLRVGVPFGGRSILLYAIVVPLEKQENRALQGEFLKTLATIIPSHCRPVIVTDAGFHRHWFEQVTALGWDYVGRIRGKFHVALDGKKMHFKKLFARARSRAVDLGLTEVGAKRRDQRRLVLSSRPKPKGRSRLTRKGTRGRRDSDAMAAAGAKEPLLLATSLTCAAHKVVKTYATRMQIEESFRDLKSHRFGCGFSCAKSRDPKRIAVMMMIATLTCIAWLVVGRAAENCKLERHFQANTIRHRRVLSLLTLGRRIVQTAMRIPVPDLRAAFDAIHPTLQTANPVSI